MTPSAVPQAEVASDPVLQWVSTPQPRPVDPGEQPVGAEPGQLAVGGLVLGGDPAGGDEHGIARPAHQRAHLVDPPREVDRGRAGVPHAVDRRLDLCVVPALAGALVHREHHPQRPRDTEGGGTPHGELGDRDDELVGGQDLPVRGGSGQQGLVEEPYRAAPVAAGVVVPLDGDQRHGRSLCRTATPQSRPARRAHRRALGWVRVHDPGTSHPSSHPPPSTAVGVAAGSAAVLASRRRVGGRPARPSCWPRPVRR